MFLNTRPPPPTTQVATQGRAAPDSGPLGTLSIRTSPAAVVALSLCPKCSSAPVLQCCSAPAYGSMLLHTPIDLARHTNILVPCSSSSTATPCRDHYYILRATHKCVPMVLLPIPYREHLSLSVQSPRSPGQEGEDDVSTRRFS